MTFSRHDSPSIWFFILVAVLFHFGVSQFASFVRPKPNPLPTDHAPIELAQVDDLDKRPVVETSESAEQAPDDGKPAPFAGEFKNRAKKQMRAERTGPFRQGQAGGLKGNQEQGKKLSSVPQEPGTENGDLEMGDGVSTLSMSDLLPVPSSQPGVLPDHIARGSQTILNTDPVIYASFINRVREELYGPWVDYVTEAAQNREIRGTRLSPNLYVTKLKVILDSDGNVVSLQTVKSSGVKAIDDAPKRAFWDREPFPNPPFELTEEKPFVPIVFEFHFEYESASFGIVPWKI